MCVATPIATLPFPHIPSFPSQLPMAFKEFFRKYDKFNIHPEYADKYNSVYDSAMDHLNLNIANNLSPLYYLVKTDTHRDKYDCGPKFTNDLPKRFADLRKAHLSPHDREFVTDLSLNVDFAIEAAARDWLLNMNNYPFWVPF